MGIHPYGLFGTNESNNPFGSDYELKRQLAARQAQLSMLSKKEILTSDEEKRKNQLTNTVNQLSNRINKVAPNNSQFEASSNNPEIKKAAVNNTTANKVTPILQSSDGLVVPKSPVHTPSEDYLKGFFLDIKI